MGVRVRHIALNVVCARARVRYSVCVQAEEQSRNQLEELHRLQRATEQKLQSERAERQTVSRV